MSGQHSIDIDRCEMVVVILGRKIAGSTGTLIALDQADNLMEK